MNVLIISGAGGLSNGDLPRILWDNGLLNASMAASSTAADSLVEYLTDDRLDRSWTPASGTSHTITGTFAAATAVSAMAIHGHNFGDLTTPSIVFEYDIGAGWVTAAGVASNIGTGTFYISFPAVEADAVRLTITHGGSVLPSIAALSVGDEMICERGVQPGWADPLWSRAPKLRSNVSRNGVPLPGTIEDATHQGTFSLANMTAGFVESDWLPFRRACDGGQRPCFLTWARDTYPDHACYCSAIIFSEITFASRGLCDASLTARMDTETGWGGYS